MIKIAFVTSSDQPGFSDDDLILAEALKTKNIVSFPVAWDAQNIEWKTFHFIIIRSSWNYYKKIDCFLQWLIMMNDAKMPVFNSVDIVLWNLNKVYLEQLEMKGVNLPRTLFLNALPDNSSALAKILRENDIRKAVIKPSISAGSFQTIVTSQLSIEEDFKKIENLKFPGKVIIQEYLDEIEVGECSLIFFDGEYSHGVLKRPKSGDFRVQKQFGGSVENFEPSKAIINQARDMIDKADKGKVLYARVDGCIRKGELCLMELELIEPSLFFSYSKKSAEKLSEKIVQRLKYLA
jgi:glutathione synthase/RimK-type ligase-like ATP-grasp enzyme